MGKRKSSRKPVTKVKARLPTIFDCVYCSHEKAVEVEMNKQKMTGTVRCRVCQASWTTTIHALSAPIDVYSDWIDACDLAASKAAGTGAGRAG
ncbi:transcription elongation factor 1, partial [Catenaria anguillulae PL171]